MTHIERMRLQAALQVTVIKITNSDDTLTIIYFNLYNCEELTDTDIIQYLDGKENKETNKYLSDKVMMEYLQIFEKNAIKGITRLASEHYTLTELRWFMPGF